MGCMGCMGADSDIDATGFDWSTGEYASDSSNNGGGLTAEGAQVITGIIDGLTNIGTGVLSYLSARPTTTPATPTGSPIVMPARAGMDPTMLMAIGIPAALIAVAVMGKKK